MISPVTGSLTIIGLFGVPVATELSVRDPLIVVVDSWEVPEAVRLPVAIFAVLRLFVVIEPEVREPVFTLEYEGSVGLLPLYCAPAT